VQAHGGRLELTALPKGTCFSVYLPVEAEVLEAVRAPGSCGPSDGTPRDGTPSDGGPSDGGPSDGRPSNGRPSDSGPKHEGSTGNPKDLRGPQDDSDD